jgi:hypothetical protein
MGGLALSMKVWRRRRLIGLSSTRRVGGWVDGGSRELSGRVGKVGGLRVRDSAGTGASPGDGVGVGGLGPEEIFCSSLTPLTEVGICVLSCGAGNPSSGLAAWLIDGRS